MRHARRRRTVFEQLDSRQLMAVDFSLLADTNEAERSLLTAGGWVTSIGDRVAMSAGLRTPDLWQLGDSGSSDATLIKDFQPGGLMILEDAVPVPLNDRTIFMAADLAHGLEPWVTDGTTAGTQMLLDMTAGPNNSSLGFGPVIGNSLYFTAISDSGAGIWKTDGTQAGTSQVFSSRDEHNLRMLFEGTAEYQGQLYFSAINVDGQRLLIRLDDTTGNFEVAAELPLGRSWHMFVVGDRLMIVDGEPISPPSRLLSYSPSEGLKTVKTGDILAARPIVLGDRAYFGINRALWSTDGTAAGTSEFMANTVDFRTPELGPAMAQLGSRVMLVQDNKYKVKNIQTGAVVDTGITYTGHPYYTSIVVDDDRFVFFGREDVATLKLYALAADSDQPVLLREVNSANGLVQLREITFAYPLLVNDRVFYPDRMEASAEDVSNYNSTIAMMETDPATGETKAFDPLRGTFGSDTTLIAQSTDWNWFTSKNRNQAIKLWQTDGTPEGTQQLPWPSGFENTSIVSAAQWIGDRLVLEIIVDFSVGFSRLSWNPANQQWQELSVEASEASSPAFDIDGQLFQVRALFQSQPVLYRLNSDFSIRSAVTTLTDPNGQAASSDFAVTQSAGRTVLSNGKGHWLTDGTSAGTRLLSAGPNPLNATDFYFQPYIAGNDIWLINSNFEFYRLGPSDNDAQQVGSLPETIFPFDPSLGGTDFHVLGDRFIFTAKDATGAQGLYLTDGTTTGTQLIRNFLDGKEPIDAFVAGVVQSKAIVHSFNARVGTTLWASDGTLDGTIRLLQHPVGFPQLAFQSVFNILPDGRALIDTIEPQLGHELWITDGTAAGTEFFADINSGSSPGVISVAVSGNRIIAVSLSDQHGDSEVFGANFSDFVPSVVDPTFYFEEERAGEFIGTVPASEELFGTPIEFRLSDPSLATTFLLDALTGSIRLQPNVSLDYETLLQSNAIQGELSIEVDYRDAATDAVITQPTTVRYEVLDRIEPPTIDDQSFTVDEAQSRGSYLVTLSADGYPASHIRFAEVNSSVFEVDAVTGRVYVRDPNALDFERRRELSFRARVTDPLTGWLDEATITLKLRDVDEAPVDTSVVPGIDLFSGTTRSVTLPNSLFKDPEGQPLTYSLTSSDGGPLPTWVSFDSTTLVATFTPGKDELGLNSFKFVATDPAGNSGSTLVKVTVFDSLHPWHNVVLPLDVNRDGAVTALDALLVINLLNSQTTVDLPTTNPDLAIFYDTSGDGLATPLDALLVINSLNSGSGEGEGALPSSSISSVQVAADLFNIEELGRRVRSASSPRGLSRMAWS